MAQEPIMWVRASGAGYKPPSITRTGDDGEPIIEKFPATAPPPEDHPLYGKPVRRWELMVDAAGNLVRAVYSGGAADYQVDHPNYGAAIKGRHRKLGWFPYGACPVVLANSGMLERRLLCPDVSAGHQCEPGTYSANRPCAHAIAEAKSRKERNARKEAKRAEAFRPEAERLARAAQATQTQQNDTLIKLVEQQNAIIQALVGGGGRWPLERPALTEEEFIEADKARHADNRANPPTDDELEQMMRAADADEAEPVVSPEPEPENKKGKRR